MRKNGGISAGIAASVGRSPNSMPLICGSSKKITYARSVHLAELTAYFLTQQPSLLEDKCRNSIRQERRAAGGHQPAVKSIRGGPMGQQSGFQLSGDAPTAYTRFA